jgi:hypothetical protein
LSSYLSGHTNFKIRWRYYDPLSTWDWYAQVDDVKIGNCLLASTQTFQSTAAHDGWVLESYKGSQKGSSLDAKKLLLIGDDALNRQYKTILSFNTSTLPPNAIIIGATLRIKQYGRPVGQTPFTALGGLLVDVRKGTFGKITLETRDFQATPNIKKTGTFGKTASQGWYSVLLNAAGMNGINRSGVTQFRLYFTKSTNGDLGSDYMRFYSGNSPTNKPELVIIYTLP